jgi:hypothetical protein
LHDVLVFEDGVLAENTIDVATECSSRVIAAISYLAEIEDDRNVVSEGEVLHCAPDGGDLGSCVGTWNATFDHLDRVASVQHGDITEVERDGVDLEEDIVRAKLSRQLFSRGGDGPRQIASGAPEGFVCLGDRHVRIGWALRWHMLIQ